MAAALDFFDIDSTGLAAIAMPAKRKAFEVKCLQGFYAKEKWRQRLTRQSVALINQHTDWQVAERFGYKMLDPKQFPIEIAQGFRARFPTEFLPRV